MLPCRFDANITVLNQVQITLKLTTRSLSRGQPTPRNIAFVDVCRAFHFETQGR